MVMHEAEKSHCFLIPHKASKFKYCFWAPLPLGRLSANEAGRAGSSRRWFSACPRKVSVGLHGSGALQHTALHGTVTSHIQHSAQCRWALPGEMVSQEDRDNSGDDRREGGTQQGAVFEEGEVGEHGTAKGLLMLLLISCIIWGWLLNHGIIPNNHTTRLMCCYLTTCPSFPLMSQLSLLMATWFAHEVVIPLPKNSSFASPCSGWLIRATHPSMLRNNLPKLYIYIYRAGS